MDDFEVVFEIIKKIRIHSVTGYKNIQLRLMSVYRDTEWSLI